MRGDEQEGAGDAEREFNELTEVLPVPGDDEDECDAEGDQGKQGTSPVKPVARDESGYSQQDDADGEKAVYPGITGQVRDQVGEEADEDRGGEAVNEAGEGGGGACQVGVIMEGADSDSSYRGREDAGG